jgi:hypothetical protein
MNSTTKHKINKVIGLLELNQVIPTDLSLIPEELYELMLPMTVMIWTPNETNSFDLRMAAPLSTQCTLSPVRKLAAMLNSNCSLIYKDGLYTLTEHTQNSHKEIWEAVSHLAHQILTLLPPPPPPLQITSPSHSHPNSSDTVEGQPIRSGIIYGNDPGLPINFFCSGSGSNIHFPIDQLPALQLLVNFSTEKHQNNGTTTSQVLLLRPRMPYSYENYLYQDLYNPNTDRSTMVKLQKLFCSATALFTDGSWKSTGSLADIMQNKMVITAGAGIVVRDQNGSHRRIKLNLDSAKYNSAYPCELLVLVLTLFLADKFPNPSIRTVPIFSDCQSAINIALRAKDGVVKNNPQTFLLLQLSHLVKARIHKIKAHPERLKPKSDFTPNDWGIYDVDLVAGNLHHANTTIDLTLSDYEAVDIITSGQHFSLIDNREDGKPCLDNIKRRESILISTQYRQSRDASRLSRALKNNKPPPAPHWTQMDAHFAAKIHDMHHSGISRRGWLSRFLYDKHWIGSNASKSLECDIEDSLCPRCQDREDQNHIILHCRHCEARNLRLIRDNEILKLVTDTETPGLYMSGRSLIRAYYDIMTTESTSPDGHCLYTLMFSPRIMLIISSHPTFSNLNTSPKALSAFLTFLKTIATLTSTSMSEHIFACRKIKCAKLGLPPPREKTRGHLYKQGKRVSPTLPKKNYVRINSTEDISAKHRQVQRKLSSKLLSHYWAKQISEEEEHEQKAAGANGSNCLSDEEFATMIQWASSLPSPSTDRYSQVSFPTQDTAPPLESDGHPSLRPSHQLNSHPETRATDLRTPDPSFLLQDRSLDRGSSSDSTLLDTHHPSTPNLPLLTCPLHCTHCIHPAHPSTQIVPSFSYNLPRPRSKKRKRKKPPPTLTPPPPLMEAQSSQVVLTTSAQPNSHPLTTHICSDRAVDSNLLNKCMYPSKQARQGEG